MHEELAAQAYTFGYPLVLMDVTARSLTSVPRPTGQHAPMNQFAHMREFPDATFTDVVSPNADTLYSSAFFDLRAGRAQRPGLPRPLLLDADARRVDERLRVARKGTTGTGPHDFAIVGPHWQGTLPTGLERNRRPDESGRTRSIRTSGSTPPESRSPECTATGCISSRDKRPR